MQRSGKYAAWISDKARVNFLRYVEIVTLLQISRHNNV